MAGLDQKTPQLKQTSPKKGTGFEEPFCPERNTTLPHPDADTSEDACIEGENMVQAHAHHHLLPFHHHHRYRSQEQGEVLSSLYYSIAASTSDIMIENATQEAKGEARPSSAQMGQRN
ncbi:hypothetical protein F5884DRAFT_814101 [Xylogone sp. PMI_703]|nr:hypothetical protein F5884DRAFT_814101 [Xylogone sp. PMI_703]